MRFFGLYNNGLDEIAKQELEELGATITYQSQNVIEFEVKDNEHLFTIIYKNHSLRRILVSLGSFKDIKDFKSEKINFNWQDFFSKETQYTINVEGVKGQENRFAIAKELGVSLHSHLETKGFNLIVNHKTPQLIINIFYNQENYFVGIDLCGKELTGRHYRTFPHPASVKGDLGFYFVKQVEYKKGNQLLVGFMKDGTIAIEAALYEQNLPVQSIHEEFLFEQYPIYKDFNFNDLLTSISEPQSQNNVYAFDRNKQNFLATRKNATIAKVLDNMEISKCALDELDVKFKENQFDYVIFHITRKDEDHINEIYYQVSYILKPKGTFLLISREQWEPSVSSKFNTLKTQIITKGNSKYKILLLQMQ